MARKKRRPQHFHPIRPQPRELTEGLAQVLALNKKGRLLEAQTLLEKLNQQYPGQQDVLHLLTNVANDLKDNVTFLKACEALVAVAPENADFLLMLAGAYLNNVFPFLALRTFRKFLQRWPRHPRAADAQEAVNKIETGASPFYQEMNFQEEEAMELAVLHEEVQVFLAQGLFPQAQAKAEELLRRQPGLPSVLNNLSQAYYAEGLLESAIANARRSLEIDPENVHALANLARYLFLNGQPEEARTCIEKLKVVPNRGFNVWTKKVEALTILGDDAGVLDVFRQYEKADPDTKFLRGAVFHHLVAVAFCRLGQEDEARQHWEEALQVEPGFNLRETTWRTCANQWTSGTFPGPIP